MAYPGVFDDTEAGGAAVGTDRKPDERLFSQAEVSGAEAVKIGSGLFGAGIGEAESMAKVLSKAETVIGVLFGWLSSMTEVFSVTVATTGEANCSVFS